MSWVDAGTKASYDSYLSTASGDTAYEKALAALKSGGGSQAEIDVLEHNRSMGVGGNLTQNGLTAQIQSLIAFLTSQQAKQSAYLKAFSSGGDTIIINTNDPLAAAAAIGRYKASTLNQAGVI